MAAVTVNRGMPRPEAPAASLPKDQWDDLVIVRKLWAQSQLPFDCRMLKLVASDAPAMATELGYGTEEAFLREGLQLDPELVSRVVDWLDQEQPKEPVTLQQADQASKAGTHASVAFNRQGAFAKAGDNQHTLKGGLDIIQTSVNGGGGTSAAYLAARLKKAGRDDLLKQIGPGKQHQSMRSAAIEAGIITLFPSLQLKDPAPTAQKLLVKKGKEWCLQLLDELSALVFED